MNKRRPTREELLTENRLLRERLLEAEQILQAIRNGEVDALIIDKPDGEQLYTLTGADYGYRVLVESITEGAAILSANKSIYYCNRALSEMLGYPPQKILSKGLDTFCAPDCRTRLTELLDEGTRCGLAKGEIQLRHAGGVLLPVNISLNHLHIENFQGICAIITDLSAQKEVEEELRSHRTELQTLVEERTQELARANTELKREIAERTHAEQESSRSLEELNRTLNSITDGFFSLDGKWRVTWFNRNGADMIGVRPEEAIGRPVWDFFPRSVDRKFYSESHRAVEARQPVHFEEFYPDPLNRWYELHCYPGEEGLAVYFRDITIRKQAEQALRESERRLRAVQELSPDGFVILRPVRDSCGSVKDFLFVYENEALARMNGTDPREIAGRSLLDMFPNHDDSPFHAAYKQVAQTGEAKIVEAPYQGGSIPKPTWFRAAVVPMGSDIAILVQDTTERKKMEEELRRSRDELELRVGERTKELIATNQAHREKAEIIDLAHDAIFVREFAGAINFWNKGAQQTYGFAREEALGKDSHLLLNTELPIAIEEIQRIVRERGEWNSELNQRKKNGERIVVDSRWAFSIGTDGNPAGFLEVNRDITGRKTAEEEFRKADRAFRTLSECNHAMVRETDEMELFRQVCRIMVGIGRYRMAWVGFAENDESKSLRPIVCAGHDDGYLDQAKITWADTDRGRGPAGTCIRTGKMAISQNALTNPLFTPWRSEAIKRGYASSISLPLIVESKVIGALTVYATEPDAFDEAEAGLLAKLADNLSFGVGAIRLTQKRRRSEQELRTYASRLETTNAELQEFAFIASHDLQEPLRKIQTFCDLAVRNCSCGLDAKTEDYLERIASSAGRMRQLLHDLLEFSRITSRAQPFATTDLRVAAHEAAEVFDPLIKETGCRLDIHELPSIEADHSQMIHLFQNLIGNSLKYRRDEIPHIKIDGAVGNDGFCEIFVEDNGIGFDPHYSDLIFKPFQRLHKRGEYSGTGMGLSICRKIVERHGGTISADGEPGKGAVFTIRLPLEQTKLEVLM